MRSLALCLVLMSSLVVLQDLKSSSFLDCSELIEIARNDSIRRNLVMWVDETFPTQNVNDYHAPGEANSLIVNGVETDFPWQNIGFDEQTSRILLVEEADGVFWAVYFTENSRKGLLVVLVDDEETINSYNSSSIVSKHGRVWVYCSDD